MNKTFYLTLIVGLILTGAAVIMLGNYYFTGSTDTLASQEAWIGIGWGPFQQRGIHPFCRSLDNTTNKSQRHQLSFVRYIRTICDQ